MAKVTKTTYKRTYSNGDIYEGPLSNDLPTPEGKYTFACGDVYVGEYSESEYPSGKGKIWFKNGDVYEGDVRKGKPHGSGTYVFAGGIEVYRGEIYKGMFHGYGVVLFCVGMLVIVATTYFLRKLCEGYRERYVAILAVLSGVVGNSIDRIWRGAVVDFLDCYINSYHWPAFNIADCAICVGIGVYMLSVILRPEAKKDAEKSENAN